MTVQDPDIVQADRAEQIVSSPAEQLVDISVRHPSGTVTVLAVAGEVDMSSAPQLRAAVAQHLSDCTTFVLDLTGVRFLGSAGLAVLVEGLEQSRRRDIAYRIVATERAVTRPLVATGLGEVFDVFSTLDEALAT